MFLFFFLALVMLCAGRQIGWKLSRYVLYPAPLPLTVILCVLWGLIVAIAIWSLIVSQQPGTALRWIMGYALGGYVAVPNFGLYAAHTIPPHVQGRHQFIAIVPQLVYIAASLALALLLPDGLFRST